MHVKFTNPNYQKFTTGLSFSWTFAVFISRAQSSGKKSNDGNNQIQILFAIGAMLMHAEASLRGEILNTLIPQECIQFEMTAIEAHAGAKLVIVISYPTSMSRITIIVLLKVIQKYCYNLYVVCNQSLEIQKDNGMAAMLVDKAKSFYQPTIATPLSFGSPGTGC